LQPGCLENEIFENVDLFFFLEFLYSCFLGLSEMFSSELFILKPIENGQVNKRRTGKERGRGRNI